MLTSVGDAGRLAWAFGLPMHPALEDRGSKARRLRATAAVGASREDLVSVARLPAGPKRGPSEDANLVGRPRELGYRLGGRAAENAERRRSIGVPHGPRAGPGLGAARQGRCVATSVEDAGRLAWAFGLPMHPALDDRRSKARRLTATAALGASRGRFQDV